jgi:RNA polymerase sigma factor (TIGR02999 family)
MVYADLRRLAQVYLRREAPGHTLQPTALVHEACLRLIGNAGASPPRLESGAHLIGVAARLMRQILVNHAHRRRTLRRGGDRRRLDLDPAMAVFEERAVDLVALDEALERLSGLDPRQARIVEMRFFGAMTVEETARALDTSVRTVERDWTMARAWLSRELAKA